jgi:hypothetical protein
MKNAADSIDAAVKTPEQIAAGMPNPADTTRISLPPPLLDEPLNNPPPLPAPATLDLTPPAPLPANGLTVQPVLLNPPPSKVRPQGEK